MLTPLLETNSMLMRLTSVKLHVNKGHIHTYIHTYIKGNVTRNIEIAVDEKFHHKMLNFNLSFTSHGTCSESLRKALSCGKRTFLQSASKRTLADLNRKSTKCPQHFRSYFS